jgi:hypothetical protein
MYKGSGFGIIRRHLDSTVLVDGQVAAREGVYGPDAGRRPEATPALFSLLAALRLHPVELVDALVRERLLEPIQELSGRVDLVVMLAFPEDRHLVKVFGEPGRRLGDRSAFRGGIGRVARRQLS